MLRLAISTSSTTMFDESNKEIKNVDNIHINQYKRKKNSDLESSSDEDDDNDVDLNVDLKNEHDLTVEERDLESLVFGSDASMLSNIDKVKKKKNINKNESLIRKSDDALANLIDERKPVWQDNDDKEMY